MIQHVVFQNPVIRRLKRSERGQSILLMAFAFIALIGFVGLVTDVALLFVRYASLRRAVDSAAIAAAGQIREGTDYANVTVAAQQYIQLHNLDPDSVLVETCETDIYYWRLGLGPWDGNPHPEALYPKVPDNMPETELCDWDDPRKLVRVSAQIESPTTFLSLLGVEEVTLEATSVSETAVIDIALVLDTSESMSKETDSSEYISVGLTYQKDGMTGTRTIRGECYSDPDAVSGGEYWQWDKERWAKCCNDPGRGSVGDGSYQPNGVLVPNGLIWHDVNGNSMYDGATENGLADNIPQSSSYTDPDGYNFTTLVCAPFKDVKDAARMFIKRLDFVRGDRVVLVTFDKTGVAYAPKDPASGKQLRPLLRSESIAVQTLDTKIGVLVNPTAVWSRCEEQFAAKAAWESWQAAGSDPATRPDVRPYSYESWGACGQTNVGGGILAGNNALTDPIDVRREAVWVMIVLSDGAANTTDPAPDAVYPNYGSVGYCPWWTFCLQGAGEPRSWPECTENNPSQSEPATPFCNDNDPWTRHFCLNWSTGLPDKADPECGASGHYDADDYARDMADFAGLIEVMPGGAQGNFIAMFSIGFGQEVVDEATAAPLLRYIADAGDNGFIDNNYQTDLREDRNPIPTYPVGGPYPDSYGEPGPCEDSAIRADPKRQCGQYYFAENLTDLDQVFEEIASRLFTRLSR